MLGNSHPKIIGATLVGFALVAGAYTVKNFGQSNFPAPINSAATAVAPRVAIAVSDSDGNGLEDWRDSFVTTESIIIESTASSTYTQPDTLTGQVGINLFEDIIRARSGGPFNQTEEDVISGAVALMSAETEMKIYDIPDILILENWTDQDIKNYGNAMAGAIIRNNVEGLDTELEILNDMLNRNKPERVTDLQTLASIYERTRDDSLLVPVPRIFLKQHLDLINTYHALFLDIEAMTLSFSDPAAALLRFQRYEDDALGLRYALENVAITLAAYPQLFSTTDQATFFNTFIPNRQTN
jgi:hypothetical protein